MLLQTVTLYYAEQRFVGSSEAITAWAALSSLISSA
jgi:hypothetical protein